MSLASSLIESASALLKIDQSKTSIPGVQNAEMLKVLNLANLEVIRSYTRSGGEPPTTLMSETGVTLIASTLLNGATAIAATSIIVDSASAAPSSGAFAVNAEIAEYTGTTATTLTGVTGLGLAHVDDSEVSFLYALPSNFHSLRTTSTARDGVLVGRTAYNFTTGEPFGGYFSLYDNGTTKYLWFPKGLTGKVLVYYNKNGTTIDEGTDSPSWETAYDNFGIYRLVAHGIRALGLGFNEASNADAMADKVLREIHIEKNVGKKIMVRPFSRSSRDTVSINGRTFSI